MYFCPLIFVEVHFEKKWMNFFSYRYIAKLNPRIFLLPLTKFYIFNILSWIKIKVEWLFGMKNSIKKLEPNKSMLYSTI